MWVRYAQGGGLTDAGRTARERLRLQAVERFGGGQKNAEIAVALRVSLRSVERWRRAWREQGEVGMLSKGSPGRSKLSEAQVVRLEQELERGPLAHGWVDQRWTLARIKALIKSTAAERGAYLVFEDEAGQSMTPPRARTWGRV